MTVKIEQSTFGAVEGSGIMRVAVTWDTDSYAAHHARNFAERWTRLGWREELHMVNAKSSVQCLYDGGGYIWETVEYTEV